jgi:hypothetical protein
MDVAGLHSEDQNLLGYVDCALSSTRDPDMQGYAVRLSCE